MLQIHGTPCRSISKEDEISMTFAGFIILFDLVKPGK